MKATAVYAGSFDPMTIGHVDVICRAAEVFDHVVVMVAANPDKNYLFTADERVAMIEEFIQEEKLGNVTAAYTNGYVFEEVPESGVLVRGIRSASDLAFEQEVAHFNSCRGVDTVFFPTDRILSEVSSSQLKELVKVGSGRARLFTTRGVFEHLKKAIRDGGWS